jgi:hypothetical protein
MSDFSVAYGTAESNPYSSVFFTVRGRKNTEMPAKILK